MKNEKKEIPYYWYEGVKGVIFNNLFVLKGGYKMSCCICDMETISVIAKGFTSYGYIGNIYACYQANDFVQPKCSIWDKTPLRQAIGQSLLNQNYRAFNYRYNEDNKPPKFVYTDIEINEGLLYGCISCYEYQACETEDYYKSNVHYSLVNLQHVIVKRLLEKVGQEAPYGYNGYNMFV